jgi:hypothetical protein
VPERFRTRLPSRGASIFLVFLRRKKKRPPPQKNQSQFFVRFFARAEQQIAVQFVEANASATVDMSWPQGFNLALASSRLVGLGATSHDGKGPMYRRSDWRQGDVTATTGLFD